MPEISIFVAFAAGIVSFLAPCVLPLIPGFLSYIAGVSLGAAGSRKKIFFSSVFFVAGFSIVFSLLGVLLNSILSSVAYSVQAWLSRIGGAIIIFFGLYLTGLVRLGFFEKEHKAKLGKRTSPYITSLLFGFAFAAGWTPCVGAALGAIIGLAAASPASAFYLLAAYSLGLGLPFLLIGFFASRASHIISRIGPYIKYINITFGIILILLGMLVFTQSLSLIASFSFLNRLLLGV